MVNKKRLIQAVFCLYYELLTLFYMYCNLKEETMSIPLLVSHILMNPPPNIDSLANVVSVIMYSSFGLLLLALVVRAIYLFLKDEHENSSTFTSVPITVELPAPKDPPSVYAIVASRRQ